MSLREHIKKLRSRKNLLEVEVPVSRHYQAAGMLKELEPTPVLFKDIKESQYKMVGNLLCTKEAFASYFDIHKKEIIPLLTKAIEERSPPEVVDDAPCQQVVITEPDLDDIPILKHFEEDGGNYITAGVMIARHSQYGQNLDFHRCMQFSKREFAIRVVQGRHFDTFLRDRGELDVAVCVGTGPSVLVAAATSVDIGIDELEIANALEPLQVVRAKTVDLHVPAQAEYVLEGKVYLERHHAEGPFVDLTGTMDIVRQEPVFEVRAITHRHDAVWQALLPGGLEHKLLMGMPREPTIFKQVNQVVRCLDVHVNPGGCSWLHAIVKIDKQSEADGIKAIEAAFDGHKSCKHVFIVDKDIDIYDPLQVEWALATRFQGERDMLVREKEPGSSLDPSAERGTKLTTKIGFDLTIPANRDLSNFEKVSFPQVDVKEIMPDKE